MMTKNARFPLTNHHHHHTKRNTGTNIPPEYIPSCEKGAKDAMDKGPLTGHPSQGIRVVRPSMRLACFLVSLLAG